MPERAAPTSSEQDAIPDPSTETTHLTDDISTLSAFGFGNMAAFGTAWIEALGDMGGELVSFVAERIKEDIKTQHEILHCKDPGKLQEIQARFVQTAIDQYTAETGKLVEMSQDLFKVPTDKSD